MIDCYSHDCSKEAKYKIIFNGNYNITQRSHAYCEEHTHMQQMFHSRRIEKIENL